MKKSGIGHGALCVLLCAFAVNAVFAQNVNREELEQNQAAVDFINYEGPHSQVDTVEQIRTIGYNLGLAVKSGNNRPGAANRYFVIHSVSPEEGGKLDADVFGLGVDAGVDHIRNLRLIIQGYLQGAYDYAAGDAALLARYVTIYNAVFRGDWNSYTLRYKTPVVQNMSGDKAGISIRFDEWPGQTLMTIPLGTGAPGSLSAVDTSSLTDRQVIDQMRQDGGGIDDRQGMVDLKEREADEATQSATLQREAIAEEEKDIQRDREETAAQRQRVEQEQRRTEQQQQQIQQQQQQAQQQQKQVQQEEAAGKISQEEAAEKQQELARQQETARRQQQEAEKQQQEAEKQQQELARQQKETEQKQQELTRQQEETAKKEQEISQREQTQEQRKQEAATAEARAEQKTQEAQQERQAIAKDQQDIIEGKALASAGTGAGTPGSAGTSATPAGAANPNLLAVSILSASSSLGRLVRLNPSSGDTVQSSQMNTVNGRTVTLLGGRIIAIAGIDKGNGAIRLVEINADTLEMIKQGEDDIHAQSLLWNSGSDLYAVTVVNGKNYLARFNTGLAKQTQSSVEIHPYATCIFQGDRILTQKADGTPLLLNAQSLR